MATPDGIPRTSVRSIWTEQVVLSRTRVRYQCDPDRFSPQEWRHLSFVRWLYQTGRVQR